MYTARAQAPESFTQTSSCKSIRAALLLLLTRKWSCLGELLGGQLLTADVCAGAVLCKLLFCLRGNRF